jgi:hypothetical protein
MSRRRILRLILEKDHRQRSRQAASVQFSDAGRVSNRGCAACLDGLDRQKP